MAGTLSVAYDLPNATAYNETCASVALVLWAQRMFETTPDSRYIDVMERALYNNVCAGMSLDGSKYFYVNPLLMIPEVAQVRFDMADTAVERQGWFKSSCCPTNVARLLTQINRYVYALGEDRLYVNLYAASEGTGAGWTDADSSADRLSMVRRNCTFDILPRARRGGNLPADSSVGMLVQSSCQRRDA